MTEAITQPERSHHDRRPLEEVIIVKYVGRQP